MIDFDKKTQEVLTTYHQRMKEEADLMRRLPLEEGMKRRDEFLLPVGQEVGQFLNALVKSTRAQHILEIGTSYGYSTIWLAEAAKKTGGKVTTLEIAPQKVAYAENQLNIAGLAGYVDFIIGDAVASIISSVQEVDFVLVDVWKELYLPAFNAFLPKLNQGAFVVADNMIHPEIHKQEAAAYRAAVRATEAFDTILLPLGSGLEVSKYLND